jgi:predicted RNA polymerase sigma factor
MMQVLAIVEAHKSEMAETTDTLGVIADIYTDLGNMEQAAVYYDRYLETLQD